MHKLTETTLTNGYGDLFYSISLEEAAALIVATFPHLAGAVRVVHNDNDDYGVEDFICISGDSAFIELRVNYGGMFDRGWCLNCHTVPHNNDYTLAEGAGHSHVIARDYTPAITHYLVEHIQFLNAPLDGGLFVLDDSDDEYIS